MGLQLSRAIPALPDVPLDWVSFEYGGIDRVDVTAIGNDIRLEIRPPGQGWRTSDPTQVQAGTLESLAGLAAAYRPRGIDAFRICNWTPGKVAAAKVRSFSV